MEKDTQNANVIACKLRPALIKVTNHRLEDAKQEQQKREKIVKRRKAKASAAKRLKARGRISLSSAKEGNYESNTKDDTDLDSANDKYPL